MSVKDSTKRAFRNSCKLSEHLLCHVLAFHDLANSFFHIENKTTNMSKDSFNLIFLAFANIKQIFELSNHYHIKIIIIELYFNFTKFTISN